jgi:hypothetical protein
MTAPTVATTGWASRMIEPVVWSTKRCAQVLRTCASTPDTTTRYPMPSQPSAGIAARSGRTVSATTAMNTAPMQFTAVWYSTAPTPVPPDRAHFDASR